MNNFCEILAVPMVNVKTNKPAFLFCFYIYKELENTQTQNICKQ